MFGNLCGRHTCNLECLVNDELYSLVKLHQAQQCSQCSLQNGRLLQCSTQALPWFINMTHPISPLVPLRQQVEEELDQLQAITGYG